MGHRVVFGVSGSIAAFKAASLASDLVQAGHEVQVVLTAGGSRFISALTFEAITGRPVPSEIWDEQAGPSPMGHLEFARWAEMVVVAPASAGALARLALGLPSDMLGAVALSATCPLLLAPAMETAMWRHPATVEHVAALRHRGALVVGPVSGRLASGASGEGRMAEPEEIFRAIEECLGRKRDLAGVRVLVTAGPTHELIDPVRFIGNRSSGKMGYAIAEEARDRGATVVLISGPTALTPPAGVQVVPVETHAEMREEVLGCLSGQEVVVMAAAVADFTPATTSSEKIKREEALSISLAPTSDIAAEAVRRNPAALHIGFALETADLEERAREKMSRKSLNMVVANAVSEEHNPFGSDRNRVSIITPRATVRLNETSKREVARQVWDAALTVRPALRQEHSTHE